MRTSARSFGFILILTALPVAVGWAQSEQSAQASLRSSSQSTASIAGSVIDSVTKQPLSGVGVRARSFGGGQGNPRFASATSDAGGHFVLDALAPGPYMINASQQGYFNQRLSGGSTSGRFIVVAPGQHTDDLVIELMPAANITGHIKNADGKPLDHISLDVVKYFYSGGQKELRGATSPHFSDADGEYRITDVAPGKYYIRAVTPDVPATDEAASDLPARKPGTSAATTTKPPTKDKDKAKPEVYATTYYPNGTDAANASPLTVRAGQDLAGIDITLSPVHTVAIDGKVMLSGSRDGVANADVTLVNADGSYSEHHASGDAKGAFALKNIPPGDYVLVARVEPANAKSKMLFGTKSIHVEDKNPTKIDVPIGTGVPISGHLHVDDKTTADLSKVTASLEAEGVSAVTALMPEVNSVQLRPDGGFTFTDVPEGAYTLDFSSLPQGAYLKSTGAVDVMESGVHVAPGQSPAPLDLTLSANAAQLTGVVLNDQMPAPYIRVVMLPTGNRRGQQRFLRRAISDQSGHFTMRGVIPGEYKVLALDGLDRSSMSDPDFLEQFEDGGETVRLPEGGSQDVRLAAIPAADAAP